MNSLTVKVIVALLSLLMITTVCTQVYYLLHDTHDTVEAVSVDISEDISFNGVVIRDEKIITDNNINNGVLDYKYSDGSKVSVNDTIASVYDSEDIVSAKKKIESLDTKLNNLKRAQNPGTTNFVKPEALKKNIDRNYKEILTANTEKDFSDINNAKNNLEFSMNVYNIVTGTEKNYDSLIRQLRKEKKKYQKIVKQPKATIKAPETGYFVSKADGYETKLNTKNVKSLTENDIERVLKNDSDPPENAVGKIFDSYTCNIVTVIDEDKRVTEGSELQMMISSSKNIYDVNVVSVKPAEKKGKSIVILSCDRLDENLADSRKISAQLVFDEYSGIKIPRKAVRFQGSQKGVYVILGKDISFKKIDVVYEGKDYILSRNTSDEKYVLQYDQILLEAVKNKNVSEDS